LFGVPSAKRNNREKVTIKKKVLRKGKGEKKSHETKN